MDTKEEISTPIESSTPEDLRAIAERLAPIARKQIDVSRKYKQPKLEKIQKAEELYYNIVTRTIKGRFNVPIPVVSGFVDTLLSKIDDEITINFEATEDADKIKCRKCAAVWRYDSAPTRGMWAIKDILAKKNAIFSGRAIYKIFSESDPKYKNYFNITDIYDFLMEPNGGWHLENHLFCGQENIFRTRHDLEAGSQYDKAQVEKLITTVSSDDFKKNNDEYMNRLKRHNNLGLDPETNNYVGVDIYNMVEWNMYDSKTGKRYYLFIEPRSGVWIRIQPLEEITGEVEEGDLPKYQWKSWATHTDEWNFLSKAPVDDVVPVAVALKTIVNFMLDEVQKRLWGQKLYDPEIIADPSQLEWDRPDKLVMANISGAKRIDQGVYQIPLGDQSTVTVNLIDYMRNFVGTEAGVTTQSKGESDEKILGIAEINQGEVADRLGLTNKQYTQCHAEIGEAYLRGLKMCMPEKLLIRMIGEQGVESAEITKEDAKFSSLPDVRVTGGKTEARRNQTIQESKSNALVTVAKLFPQTLNPKIASEAILRNGQWELDEITPILDPTITGNEDEDVRASQAIQEFLKKKTPDLYTGATTRFMQKIIDYANKTKTDKIFTPAVKIALMKFVMAHMDIVAQNMQRKQMLQNIGTTPQPPEAGAIKSPMQPNEAGEIVPQQ